MSKAKIKTEYELVQENVDQPPWGPTEPDEEEVLIGLGYHLNEETGVYEGLPRTMVTEAERMLQEARMDLGMSGRPNQITEDYASRNGSEFLTAHWCDMAVTHWARESGNRKAVLPEGDRAYTVWHAEDGLRLGRWHTGTVAQIKEHARPGAIMFVDHQGSNDIGAIDHVGVVEVNLGDGRLQTIEGNVSDRCVRTVRGAADIAGFWNPAYNWTEAMVEKLPTLHEGDHGKHVRTMHHLMLARDTTGLEGLGDDAFTAEHAAGIRRLQQAAGVEVDAIVGPETWSVLLAVR
ncbi:hypothetical protein Ssi03_17090 [Sphaerisporangium siamense]|uniref:Peptidase C51 domain-containing protein n=1 Tax=Sphaerisporangium siamense TaxID=795645 RepID=A0A7W7GCT1_9ACTN|nr:CHAP domain-containing protein [Sphaerisporangium siamense]MBB4704917.1 hypothetical protein [Sphaerisporangium siamense]GII83719.1 hypothetical protein Ssi03_17090 [Sphaerisporangium siamense]